MPANNENILRQSLAALKWHLYLLLFKKLFRFWERLGFHVTKNHFYEPIPDTRTLDNRLWEKELDIVGINFNEIKQLALLQEFVKDYKIEYNEFPLNAHEIRNPHDYFVNNGSFESVDGEILYSMIRYFKPKKIYEIGSGYSTLVSARAIRQNSQEDHNYSCEFVAIEPYPPDFIRADLHGFFRLVPQKVQNVSLSEFTKLQANDILFIDSSHVLKIGSDVQYEFLEILPRLNRGVIVHVHDIFLPAEYLKEWVLQDYKFWNEQYMLQAFLAFNERFEILWGSSYMHLTHPAELEKAFASYNRTERWPQSFWFRRFQE